MVQSQENTRAAVPYGSSLRRQLRLASYKIPGFLAWRLYRNLHLSPWIFNASGQEFEVLASTSWIEKIRKDKGKGELTGVDCEKRYEAAFCDMFLSKLDASSVLLDVGAGYGLYSVVASRICQSRNIHCFEPDPVWRWILSKNNRKYCNDELRIVPRLVSAETKDKSVTLDDYCARNSVKPTLIKMDIEGGELQAVAGMRRICMEHRPVILMEFHLGKICKMGEDPLEVLRMLKSYGYRLLFNGHHWHLVEHAGESDSKWRDTLPNNVNCALVAEQ